MSPDDPRHGSVAGYIAHRRSGVTRCDPCLRAWVRYDKRRKALGGLTVSTLGTQRRIQALRCLGWSIADIARACGYKDRTALKKLMGHPTMSVNTANKVAAVYEEMSMRHGDGPKAHWNRKEAERHGWAPPLAWDDIDDPREKAKDIQSPQHLEGIIDSVVVDRAITDNSFDKVNLQERREIVARWCALGRPVNELARLSGWKVERYYDESTGSAA